MEAHNIRRGTLAVTLALGALAASTDALAQRYIDLPGTQSGGLAEGTPLESSTSCGVTCHYSRDPEVPSAMPYDGWLGSMMGNAVRDPLFLAALTVAEQDAPGVGDWCLRCHTPPGFVGGRTRGALAASRGAELLPEDRDGVTCDSCHRMVATTNLGNAQYQLSPTETRFGPYADIVSIRHPGAVSTWLPDSRMCGTCHEVTNPTQPLRRADGTDTGQRVPLDTTYSEWARSAFAAAGSPEARSCQDCHLPRVEGSARVSSNDVALLRSRPRRHDLAGANAWGLRVLGRMRGDVASGEFYDPDAAPFYEAGAQRAEATLRAAVSLEVREAPRQAAPGERVTVVARLTNLSGHRVPTGYTDGRRAWLEVTVIDADRRETPVSGAYDLAQARLAEPDPQLRVYEALHGRAGMGVSEHIALHDTIVKDTRLPPRGYRPLPGHEPVGVDYSGGEDGALRHWDDARYTFTIPAGARGPLTVRVRALYQTTTRGYVEFLARENRTDDRGRELLRLYEASGRAAPFSMAEATTEVTLTAPAADAGPPDGGADASTMDAGPPSPGDPGCGCRVGRGAGGGVGALGVWALGALGVRRRRRGRRGGR
ncbi:MAG: hypothetical protein HY909_08080 [Deltaproteobacteria bacterium]|nr:hypothetical protein [Deltaproteobacteria bacterium]